MASRGWLVAVGIAVALAGCTQDSGSKGSKTKQASSAAAETKKMTAEALPTGSVSPVALAADENYLYWTNATAKSGNLMRASHDASSLGMLAKDEPGSSLIATDATHVYWRVAQGFLRVAKEGGVKEAMAVWEDAPPNIAAHDGKLYFADPKKGTIMVATPDGKANVFLKGIKDPGEVAADGVSVYWTAAAAADGTGKPGKIMRAPVAGGQPVMLAEGQEGARALTIDDLSVYWLSPGDGGSARAVSKGGGEVLTLASQLGNVKNIHSDNKYVYIAAGKTIQRAPVKGGELELVTAVEGGIGSLASDARYVYWNDYGRGKVYRAPKP